MNNYFINITKNLDLKPSTVSNTNGINKITKNFDGHISVCKIKDAYSEIFSFNGFHGRSQESSFQIKLKKIFHVWYHSCKYPKIFHLKYLINTINHSFKESRFPDE